MQGRETDLGNIARIRRAVGLVKVQAIADTEDAIIVATETKGNGIMDDGGVTEHQGQM